MEMFLMVGLIYWVINQILTIVQTIFEGRVSRRFQ
jgi:cystine transport system permease protein